jgi:hypothetical protein
MFHNNRIYGNSAALNRYLGREIGSPIWGEIQHSIDFNMNAILDSKPPSLVRRYFTWRRDDAETARSQIKANWNFLPIGDPFIYETMNLESALQKKSHQNILIIPRFDRSIGGEVTKRRHSEILDYFTKSELDECDVSLHPGEINNYKIRTLYEATGARIVSKPSFMDSNFLTSEVFQLSNYSTVFSNYIGPTIIRAIYLGSKANFMNTNFNPRQYSEYGSLLNPSSSQPEQKKCADDLLGKTNILSRDDLLIAVRSPFNKSITKVLRQTKWFRDINYRNLIKGARITHLRTLCTNCIGMSKCRIMENKVICGSCGNMLKIWDDFICEVCEKTFKISEANSHLAAKHIFHS